MRTGFVNVAVLAALVPVCVIAAPGSAAAWQIMSALTAPCHEHFSLSALPGVDGTAFPGDTSGIARGPLFPPSNTQEDDVVSGIAALIADEMGVTFDSYPTALAALSMFVGSRYPDITEGSAYDFFVMRPLMLSDAHEDSHFLRRSWEDGTDGNVAAAAGARELITSELSLALDSARGPLADRFVAHTVSIDFYGDVEVVLYEPAYRLGRALHTFEDSFSHTLRSDDLASIISVLTSIDAVSSHFDERRDGLAHSLAMDRCMEDAAEVAFVCAAAVREFVAAASDTVDPSMQAGVDAVLDRWLSVTPGCDIDNNYCDARWLETVRRDPYGPFIPMVLGCGPAAAGNPWMVLLMFIPVLVFRARRCR